MDMKNSERTRSAPAHLGVLVFSAVFALAFGAGGVFGGLLPLARMIDAAWAVRSWQPVPALVLSSELVSNNSGDSTTYAASARYRYTVGDDTHESTRIGLDTSAGSDNIGNWHQEWHARLTTAKDREQTITAWVDPTNPARSVLDPKIRWAKAFFHLPFALLFTGVGLVASWAFFRILFGREVAGFGAGRQHGIEAEDAAQDSTGTEARARNSASRGQWFLWFFALFWCGLSFPMAGVVWTTGTPWWVQAFMSVFVVVGVGLLIFAARQSFLAWQFAGSSIRFLPAQPLAGDVFELRLALTARALRRSSHQHRRVQLAQYRVDDASSGKQERQVQVFEQAVSVVPDLQGAEHWHTRFELPQDAPTHGGRRSGERVDWRLEILGDEGQVVVSYDVPVQAQSQAMGVAAQAPDAFDRKAQWTERTREQAIAAQPQTASAFEMPVPQLPAHVQVLERADAWEVQFGQTGWRWAAITAVAVAAVMSGLWWRSATRVSWQEALGAGPWWVVAALLLFALHAATRRWSLELRDDGLVLRAGSWMWRVTRVLPMSALDHLFHKLQYSKSGSNASMQEFHSVFARELPGAPSVRLTPGLPGAASAQAVAHALQAARANRAGRFSAGAVRTSERAGWRLGGGWLVWLAAVLLLAAAPRWLLGPPLPGTSAANEAWLQSLRAVDERLVNAQDAGNAPDLEQALRDGANPNLLNGSGSSMLMLAAYRGQLGHVDLLLRHGATPDLRQTQKDSERDDTALLRAFYGGHLAVVQRLVQAGASLGLKNRWDWGAVHMAAQSGCVPCLEWLAEQGLPLDEVATASRGETPLMLAAARGKVDALAWFEAKGQDLWARDPHGQDALAWARWGRQRAAEDWLLARQPANR